MDSGGKHILDGPGPPCEGAMIRGKDLLGVPDDTRCELCKNG